MKRFELLGRSWPFTGRFPQKDAKLEVHHIHAPWDDLMWWNEATKQWVYVSTLPHELQVGEVITLGTSSGIGVSLHKA